MFVCLMNVHACRRTSVIGTSPSSVSPLVVILFQESSSRILAAAIAQRTTSKLARHADYSHVHVCNDSLLLDREYSCCQ